MTARVVIVRGQMHGIGYRAWTELAALERGLQGWVRNRRDGSVEALFIGVEETVDDMIARCQSGPPGARVDSVDQRDAGPDDVALRRRDELFSVLGTV